MASLAPEALQRERALAVGLVLDALLLLPYTAVSLWQGSNVLLAEAIRVNLMFVITVVSFVMLRRVHRGSLADFDYGVGKLERGVSALVSLLLMAGGCFVLWRAFQPVMPAQGGGALLGILFAGINWLVNLVSLLALWRAEGRSASIIVNTQYRARLAKTLGSTVVLGSVILGAVLAGGRVAAWADLAGSLCVAAMMAGTAYGMIREAMPDLLDKALAEPLQQEINRCLSRHFMSYEELLGVRTRRSGNQPQIELTLGFAGDLPLARVCATTERMRAELEAAIEGARVTVIPVSVDGAGHG